MLVLMQKCMLFARPLIAYFLDVCSGFQNMEAEGGRLLLIEPTPFCSYLNSEFKYVKFAVAQHTVANQC